MGIGGYTIPEGPVLSLGDKVQKELGNWKERQIMVSNLAITKFSQSQGIEKEAPYSVSDKCELSLDHKAWHFDLEGDFYDASSITLKSLTLSGTEEPLIKYFYTTALNLYDIVEESPWFKEPEIIFDINKPYATISCYPAGSSSTMTDQVEFTIDQDKFVIGGARISVDLDSLKDFLNDIERIILEGTLK